MKKNTCLKITIFLLLITNFYLLMIPFKAHAEEEVSYIHQDHLGSTTLVTDSQGSEVSRQVYYPYGRTRNSQLPVTEKQYDNNR